MDFMLYNEWEPFYHKILIDFKFKTAKENQAAEYLDKKLKDLNTIETEELGKLINKHEIVVFGAGPSLEKSIAKYKDFLKDKIKISADGATTALLINGIIPDVIVTDLDGKISDLINANEKGSIIIIHAHSNNIDKLKKYVNNFKKNIYGTTQINPYNFKFLNNFGGFTDGDRAVFLSTHFNAKNIYLIGFDFNNKIGKYSYPKKKNKTIKLKKLKWCKYLIEFLINKNNNIRLL
jgi:uncharacterized Rossmann fold enzyme